jgi:SAM-dependent methyltransferase
MEDEARQRYLGDDYLKRNPSYHLEHATRKADELVALLDGDAECLRDLVAHVDAQVVEIGCGAGGVVSQVAGHLGRKGVRARYSGFDISPLAIELARRQGPEVEFRCEDFLAGESTADLGLMVDFFEHLPDPATFLTTVRPRLRWALFRIPLDDNLYNRVFRRFRDLRDRLGHLHFYDRRGALRLLSNCGYVVRQSALVENFRDPSNLRSRVARLNYYPRAGLSVLSRSTCADLLGGISMVVLARAGNDTAVRR